MSEQKQSALELRQLIYELQLVLHTAIARLKKVEKEPRIIEEHRHYGGGPRTFAGLGGTIADAQTPNTLLLDGSRKMIDGIKFTDILIKQVGSGASGAFAFRDLADANYRPAYFSSIYGTTFQALGLNFAIKCKADVGGHTLIQSYNGGWKTGIDAYNNKVLMPNLPVADPHVVGELWNDSGTVKVSAG